MQSFFLSVADKPLHCVQWGHGTALLIAFHGYGNDAFLFEGLAQELKNEYTTISVSLPHHGESDWPEAANLAPTDLIKLVNMLCDRLMVARFSLLGFSMGGRVALCILERMAAQVDRVLLIASDGLVPNPLYYFVTKNAVGTRLFAYATRPSAGVVKPLSYLARWKIIDASRMKFVEHYLGSEEQKRKLRLRWPSLSNLKPNISQLRKVLQQEAITVHLVFGRWDRIIPRKNAEALEKGLRSVQVHVLETGHRLVVQPYYTFYRQLLLAS